MWPLANTHAGVFIPFVKSTMKIVWETIMACKSIIHSDKTIMFISSLQNVTLPRFASTWHKLKELSIREHFLVQDTTQLPVVICNSKLEFRAEWDLPSQLLVKEKTHHKIRFRHNPKYLNMVINTQKKKRKYCKLSLV